MRKCEEWFNRVIKQLINKKVLVVQLQHLVSADCAKVGSSCCLRRISCSHVIPTWRIRNVQSVDYHGHVFSERLQLDDKVIIDQARSAELKLRYPKLGGLGHKIVRVDDVLHELCKRRKLVGVRIIVLAILGHNVTSEKGVKQIAFTFGCVDTVHLVSIGGYKAQEWMPNDHQLGTTVQQLEQDNQLK